MIVAIIIITVAVSVVRIIEETIKSAFSGDWMQIENPDEISHREMLERENTEYDMGHDVSYKDSEDL